MKFHGITLQEGSTVANMTLASGTSFPSNPNEGELFFRSDSDTSVRGMYAYIGGNWDRLASADALTVPSAANFPSTANVGDLFYKDSNDVNEALYVYNGSSWVATGNSGGTSTVDGDLSGTISIGGTSTLTLDTVASAGTSGSASKTVTITIDAKGRVTSLTEQDVAIAASQVTSGTFADARIAQSNVTQHQAAINIAASQVTSGTFTDARVAQSNVTQHQAALTIAETQITNGSVLARVADNETISGNWAFNGTVSGQTPTNGAHLVTKDYADALATGLDFKQSVKAATTTNITLSGSQTIDDVAISAGMRVLVKDQTDGTQNGIYVAAAGAWTRAADADNTPSNEVTSGMFCYVEEGTVNADSGWVLATNDVITLGSTNLVFTQFTGLGQITAGNGLTKSGNTINVGGNAGRIVVNVDDIDLATVTDSGTGSFKKISVDSYGRVTGTTDVVSSDITSLVDSTYVNAAGDTMTGLLTISRTGNGLVVASTDPTASNNSGIILNTTANATASSRIATIVLDANGADGTGGDYVTMNAFGSGDFTINNRNPAAITFQTNATERVRIDSSGNLIVGSATSSGFGLLQVSSSLQDFADFSTSFAGEAHVRIRNTTGNPVYTMYQNANTGTTASDGFWVGINSGGSAVISNQESAPLLLQTSGIERLRIDSSGNVGIGATSAAGFLTVRGGTGAINTAFDTPTAGDTRIEFKNNGTRAGYLYWDTNEVRHLSDGTRYQTFYTNGLERMRIDASGNVGIGTNSVTAGAKLDLRGMLYQNSIVANTATNQHVFNANGNNYPAFYDAGLSAANGGLAIGGTLVPATVPTTATMFWNVNTNVVGVGTTAPASKLHVKGVSGTQLTIDGSDTTTGAIGTGAQLEFRGHDGSSVASWTLIGGFKENATVGDRASFMSFYTRPSGGNMTERMRIDSSGVVTQTSNNAEFRLTESGTYYGSIKVDSSGGLTIGSDPSNVAANSRLIFGVDGSERMRIDSGGRVGIGFVPLTTTGGNGNTLQVGDPSSVGGTGITIGSSAACDIQFSRATTGANQYAGLIRYNQTSDYMALWTASAERVRIDSSGNIAIGLSTANLSGYGAGVRVMTIQGNSLPGTIELALNLATGANNTLGELTFVNNASTVTSKQSAYITGFQDGTSTTAPGGGIKFTTRADGGALAERMRIDSTGSVGIGGTPTTKLDVISSAASDLISSVRNTGTTGASILSLSSGNGTTSSKYSYVRFLNSQTSPRDWRLGTYGTDNFTIRDETASSNRLAIDTNGNVGINMAAAMTYKLEIGASGVLALNDSTNTNKGTLQMTAGGLEMYATGSKYIAFGSNSIERVRIDSSGNLLVGATSAVSSERARIENTSAGGVPNTLRLTNAGTTAGTGADLSFVSYTNATVASTIASISGISSDTAGNGLLAFNTSGVERMRIDASGNVLVTGSGGLGYGTGAGGTVTQATSKTTGVTLNKLSGAITLNASSLAANTVAAFTFTNSTIAASDVVHISVKSGMATGGSYNVSVDAVNTGSCNISVRNLTAGALAEALVLNFVVIKAATS